MTNEQNSDTPATNPQEQPLTEMPVTPPAPEKCEMGRQSQNESGEDPETTKELRREFRWFEVISLVVQVGLAIIGVFALCIYSGQLGVMRDQLGKMSSSGKQTDQLICLYGQQLSKLNQQVTNTHELAVQAKKQADIARDSLQSVQRAFVVPGTVENLAVGASNTQGFIFGFHWDNSGVTPTRHFRTHVSWQPFASDLPDNFEFPDKWNEGVAHVNTRSLIGPKGSTIVSIGPIPAAYIIEAAEHRLRLYFWGWARYNDVFPKTHEHVTMFCSVIVPEDLQKGPTTTTFSYRLEACKVHNCSDDDCAIKP